MADVLAAIAVAPDLSKARRQDLASAVRTVARVLGRAPELIPCDPILLGRRLGEISPLAIDMTKARWNNVRSLLNSALALTRPMLPGHHREPLLPAWAALHQALPSRGLAARLSRVLHWLSARGIEPAAVTENDLLTFADELRTATLAKKPEEIWRGTAWAWNKAQRLASGWPAITLPVKARRQTYTLPWTAFPPSLKADVDRLLDRLAGRDLAEDGPPPARPATLELRERQLRGFASGLVHAGRPAESLTSLADLLTLDAFKAGLRFQLTRRGDKPTSSVENLAAFLKSVAKHFVGVDADTLGKMGAIVRKVTVRSRGLTAKNRERLRQLDDPAKTAALIDLPWRLMARAESKTLSPRFAALAAQSAVAIEILLVAPLRIGNLVALDLERHFIWRAGLQIVIPEHEVKNGVELYRPLPPESAQLINRYLEKYRPLLAPPGNTMLFPGQGTASKTIGTLRRQIQIAIFEHTGLTMHPHLFRHATAKIYLDVRPGQYEVVRQVLGHKSMDTTVGYYAGGEIAAAVRHFDAVILSLRSKRPKERP